MSRFLNFASSLFFAGMMLVVPAFAAESLPAETRKDIPYYPENLAASGDAEYRALRVASWTSTCPSAAGDKKPPTVVWFHGGGLTGGSKDMPAGFKNQPLIFVTANYRLLPKASATDAIEDAAAAVAWAITNVERLGGDPKKIYVSGHSAGGYLALMLGMNAAYLEKHGLKNTDLAGLYPVSAMATTHFAILEAELAKSGKTKPAEFRRTNPIVVDAFAPLFYSDRKLPPIALLCGDPKVEWPARVEENQLLAAMLRTVKDHNAVDFQSYPDTDHGSCVKPSVEWITAKILGESPR
ncbi:MAG: alpha/beta hydrolase [Pirellulales bacterium]